MSLLRTVLVVALSYGCSSINQNNVDEAKVYLANLDVKVCERKHDDIVAEFNYYTNSTDENFEKMIEADAKPLLPDADIVYFDWKSFNDPYLLRQASFYGLLKNKSDPEIQKAYSGIIDEMVEIANTKRPSVCFNTSSSGRLCGYELYLYMEKTRNVEERAWYWKANVDKLCRDERQAFEKYVNISNIYAKSQGYKDRADMMISAYEEPKVDQFECVMEDLWDQVKPLYVQYFSYFRSRLREYFGKDKITNKAPIPIHLYTFYHGVYLNSFLGKPYSNKIDYDVTAELKKQNYTVLKIARLAEDYYKSLGLGPLPDEFWEKSMFVDPKNRPVDCDPTSWDLLNKKDYRMIICGKVDAETLRTFMHEVGHIYEFMGYKDQPCCFRTPASLGLDEGLAESMKIPATSYKYLQRMQLIDSCVDIDSEVITNILYSIASDTISSLPMVLLTDLWRYKMFRGEIPPDKYNKVFWEYRYQYQGVVAPEERSEEYIDAVTNSLLTDDTELISYFIQIIFEFQNIEAQCIAAGQFDPNNPKANPLHNCDLYGSKEAGNLMTNMYKLGSSVPWTKVMKSGTGKDYLDAGSLLRYFQPLYDWLVEENKKNKEFIGWEV